MLQKTLSRGGAPTGRQVEGWLRTPRDILLGQTPGSSESWAKHDPCCASPGSWCGCQWVSPHERREAGLLRHRRLLARRGVSPRDMAGGREWPPTPSSWSPSSPPPPPTTQAVLLSSQANSTGGTASPPPHPTPWARLPWAWQRDAKSLLLYSQALWALRSLGGDRRERGHTGPSDAHQVLEQAPSGGHTFSSETFSRLLTEWNARK